MRAQLNLLAACGLFAWVLSACGGGGGGPGPTEPAETLFTPTNAWQGSRPADAESMAPEAFRAAVALGEWTLTGPQTRAAQRAARDEQRRADITALSALPAPGHAVQALLAEVASGSGVRGDAPTQVDGLSVQLLGQDVRLRQAAQAEQRAQSADNALQVYRQTYGLLSPALQAQVPLPDSLQGRPLSAVQEALAALETALAGVAQLDRLRPDAVRPATKRALATLAPGQGQDNDGTCNPSSYAASRWFPLKTFISPVKSQGRRGTCWAFAAIGALESRERVQNNNPVDLSEQFFINKVKEDWDASDDVEGYFADRSLDLAADKAQNLPTEPAWTYNRSTQRVNGAADDYSGACNPYGNGAAGGTCSESAHQSRRACTTVLGADFCAYSRTSYTGAGVRAGRTAQVWASGQRFDLNHYRFLLSQGVALMASMPVYRGFQQAPSRADAPLGTRGVVSSFDATYMADDGSIQPGARGGHAVLVVAFVPNEDLGPPGSPASVPGGGYFVIKNSWGCGAGDGGFYYVPAAYVEFRFAALSMINFDARRSDAWSAEQAQPGSQTAPTIVNRGNFGWVPLRLSSDLAALFRVTHPAARAVRVTVSTDLEGVLFDDSWDTDRNAIAGTALFHTFATEGRRLMTVVARYGSTQAVSSFTFDVLNQSPTLQLLEAGLPTQGQPYAMTAQPADPNEPDARTLCARTVWEVAAPDTLATPTGCVQQVLFGAQGERLVTVTTTDSEGRTATVQRTAIVGPPPANPFPKIVSAQVLSREMVGAIFRVCGDAAVEPGGSIDLRARGCLPSGLDAGPARYSVKAVIDNPSNELVRAHWNVYATVGGIDSNLFNGDFATDTLQALLVSPGVLTAATHDCRVSLWLEVPADQSRSKRLDVWVGRCTYLVGRLN